MVGFHAVSSYTLYYSLSVLAPCLNLSILSILPLYFHVAFVKLSLSLKVPLPLVPPF